MKDKDKLFVCSWCGITIKDDVAFDVICCELPDELKGQFIKEKEGRVVDIMVGKRKMPIGVPSKSSEAARGGADITFTTCSEVCRSTIELILDEAGWIHADDEEG